MGAKILIVDDQPLMLRVTGYPLLAEGYDIITAENGADALKKVQTERPDLVILDIMLPDISGLEVCQDIRNKLKLDHLPIIILSGRDQVSDKVKGLEAGADEYVTKPVAPAEMVARVRRLLQRARRVQDTAQSAQRGKGIAFIGAKGGAGTTTVALNVALALLKRGKRAIAVELRPSFGTFTQQLGLTPAANLSELLHLSPEYIDERRLNMHLVASPMELRVLLGPQRASQFKDIPPEQADAIVKGLARMCEYVIIDLPHIPSEATRAALRHCDSVLIVLEPDLASLVSAKATLQMLTSWGVGSAIVRAVVVNRLGASQLVPIAEINRELGCEVAGVMTSAPDLSMRALHLGRPLVISAPDSLAAGTLIEMADRLAAELAATIRQSS
jgi:Flp pilus assembly CpaE family ATPase